MGERARVLWLIKGLGPGGAERLLVETAKHLDRGRFDVRAAYLLPWKGQLAGELRDAGVPTRCLDVRHPADPMWLGRLRSQLHGVDLVHAHLPVAGIAARVASRGLRHRPAVVYTEHNTWQRYRQPTRSVNGWTFSLNDAAIAVSRTVAGSIRSRRPAVGVIANGVDVAGLRAAAMSAAEARAALGIPSGVPLVGTVGGLTPKKGHLGSVRAASAVLERVPNARFVFVGLPVDPGPIEAEIAARGLQDRVVLAGYRPEAARLMRAFDVFCLPSRFEGMPISLLEAMALGVAPVATRVGGTPEVVTDGRDGVLVPPDDPDALASALIELLTDEERRASLGARAARTAEDFDIRTMVRATEAVWTAALERRG